MAWVEAQMWHELNFSWLKANADCELASSAVITVIIIELLILAAACLNHSFIGPTIDISGASNIQFRFVQEEHAGGYCNCWFVDNLVLKNVSSNVTLRYAVIR